jgi:xanthine dehydrogenase accessory factor
LTEPLSGGTGSAGAGAGTLFDELRRIVEEGGRTVVLTVVAGERVGAKLLVREDGTTVGDDPGGLGALAPAALRRGRSHVLTLGEETVFAEVIAPPPRLFIYGAVDTAEALCRGAKLLGWTSIVADARALFATRERLPSADELLVAWPEEAFAQVRPDVGTAIVVLTHDDKFDLPALTAALASEAFYIGALGSRRNQERRRELLLEAGAAEPELDRIAGPSGLDIGAESPAETALSMLAEILAARAGRSGGPLKDAATRIHAEPLAGKK